MCADKIYQEVFSTDVGSICKGCSKPSKLCSCKADKRRSVVGNGNVKVRREVAGRGGKTVTTITGLALNRDELKGLLSDLKRLVGGGGTECDGILELQGDHREVVVSFLLKRGIASKIAGG